MPATVTNTYDTMSLRSRLEAIQPSAFSLTTLYSYDDASRLKTIGDDTNTATYSYLANSPFVEQITFKQNTSTRMTTTKAYDSLNRLTSISHLPTAGDPISYSYGYNAANQRTNVTHADNSFWEYAYDHLGQVKRGTKNKEPGTPYPGLQFEYEYDDIGNRTETRSGGDTNGGNLRLASYGPNLLNQYASRDVPPYLEVHGEAATNAIVTVNNQPTDRLGGFFRKELNPDNSSGPFLQGITNVAVLPGAGAGGTDIVTTESGSRTLAPTPETFTYDVDGNLITDGLWTNTWNGENRLIQMESRSSVPTAARKKLLFTYDFQGRRIRKEVHTWDLSSNSYLPSSTNSFVYDGWNLIAELDGTGSVLHRFTWGLDLSGSLQGAGGVGGYVFYSTTNKTHLIGHDGNGNVTTLVDGNDSTVSGAYEYSPFGRVVRTSGSAASVNVVRFSGKYQDFESGYSYYGFRFYNPETGRWLNRDPIGEHGGKNVYGFVGNGPTAKFDVLGQIASWIFGNPQPQFDPGDPNSIPDVIWNQVVAMINNYDVNTTEDIPYCTFIIRVDHYSQTAHKFNIPTYSGFTLHGCMSAGGTVHNRADRSKTATVQEKQFTPFLGAHPKHSELQNITGTPNFAKRIHDDYEAAKRRIEAFCQLQNNCCVKYRLELQVSKHEPTRQALEREGVSGKAALYDCWTKLWSNP